MGWWVKRVDWILLGGFFELMQKIIANFQNFKFHYNFVKVNIN